MKINFAEFELVGIDWKVQEHETPLYQIIGNKIREFTPDIWLKEIAESIYRGEEVELNSQQVEFVKSTLSGERTGLMPFFARELNIFIDKH